MRLGLPALVAAQTLALTAVLAPALTAPAAAAPTAATATAPVPTVAAASGSGSDASADGSSFTVVQANLLSPQSDARFRADVRRVYAQSPDLITFNEVAFRQDGALARPGYELWRTPGQYLGPTPVAWRSEAFTREDQGTFQLSDYEPRPPGRRTRLGMRFANWVTLRSRTQGTVVSVVSAHIAPPVDGMPDLLEPSMARLQQLVATLGERGPVVVGGDFNVHVRSKRYPAQALASAGLRSTYEMTGTVFPTGDHRGATIDYVFVRPDDQLQVLDHHPVELNSDHDAVVANLSWTGAPVGRQSAVRNDPRGSRAERRAVLAGVLTAVRETSSGETLRVATRRLSLPGVRTALAAAARRGVTVRLVTRSPRLTSEELRLRNALGAHPRSRVVRCVEQCARSWGVQRTPTVVLLSAADGSPRLSLQVSRRLRPRIVTRASRVVTVIDAGVLAGVAARFRLR